MQKGPIGKFTAEAPNKAWLTDITYGATGEGWLYLAGHKDLFNGEIVAYAMGERMTKTWSVSLCHGHYRFRRHHASGT